MQRLLITEFATKTIEFSRTYVLVLAEGETAADYLTEIANIEWVENDVDFTVEDDLTAIENASQSDIDEYEVVGADLDAINAELQEPQGSGQEGGE